MNGSQIRAAQIAAGEAAVITDLQRMVLVATAPQKARCTLAGEINVESPDNTNRIAPIALLIEFPTREALREALHRGSVEFDFL